MDSNTQLTLEKTAWPQNRITSFTDSVFAFAITLLVLNLIELRLPIGNQSLVPFLKENGMTFLTFIVTFVIIARFWMSHLKLFAAIRESDRKIVNLNVALLFFITIFPFMTSVIGSHTGNRDAVVMYAACFAIIGIIQYEIGYHAYQKKLLKVDDLTPGFMKVFTFYSLSTPAVFMVSIALAFVSPHFAEILWMALLFIRSGFRYFYRHDSAAEVEVEKL